MPVDLEVTGFHFKTGNKKTYHLRKAVSLNPSPTQMCIFYFPFKITHFKYSLALLNFKEVCLDPHYSVTQFQLPSSIIKSSGVIPVP